MTILITNPLGHPYRDTSQGGPTPFFWHATTPTNGRYAKHGTYQCVATGRFYPREASPFEYPANASYFLNNTECGRCWAPSNWRRGTYVTYMFNASFDVGRRDLFRGAVDSWNSHEYEMHEEYGAAQVEVFKEDLAHPWAGMALASPSGGWIKIDVNGFNGYWNNIYTQAVMAHEIGHMYGFGDLHSGAAEDGLCDDRATVMWYSSVTNDAGVAPVATCNDGGAVRYRSFTP